MPRSQPLAVGFWFAQQGAIYVFVILIFVYIYLMNRLDQNDFYRHVAQGLEHCPDTAGVGSSNLPMPIRHFKQIKYTVVDASCSKG